MVPLKMKLRMRHHLWENSENSKRKKRGSKSLVFSRDNEEPREDIHQTMDVSPKIDEESMDIVTKLLRNKDISPKLMKSQEDTTTRKPRKASGSRLTKFSIHYCTYFEWK